MTQVFIGAAKRTPIGRLTGALSSLSAVDLGAGLIKQMIADTGVDAKAFDDVILGQVLTAGVGQNPARQTAINAGLDTSTPAITINQVCGSGQRALHLATQAIGMGDAELVIAGGQESMSQAGHVMNIRQAGKLGDTAARDTILVDGLEDATHHVHMGMTAEHLAEKFNVSRQEQDAFALASQTKAADAIAAGRMADEIIPVTISTRKGDIIVDTDEHPMAGLTPEKLAKLRPAFDKAGSVTAGNASGVNDGAAALFLGSEAALERNGLPKLARIVSTATTALAPMEMGLGPISASRKALEKAGWKMEDLDLIEVNEAFAAQAICVNNEMGWNADITNVNGGAIALGHPIGASGARIVVTLLHEMIRRDAKKGLAALCIGGGQGVAICIER